MSNKIFGFILGAAIIGVGIGGYLFGKNSGGNLGSAPTTDLTLQTSNSSYTDGADFRQNVQAMAERFAGRAQYEVLQADSAGRMQPVAPTALAGDWKVPSLVQPGTAVSKTATTTLTAAEVCDSKLFQLGSSPGNNPTITFPTAASLFADCVSANADQIGPITFWNSATSSYALAAGTSSTLKWNISTTTINPGVTASVWIFRTSTVGGYGINAAVFAN